MLLRLAIVVGIAALIARIVRSRQPEDEPAEWPEWTPRPDAASSAASWVDPDEHGDCPTSHPVKLKASSGIFHLPGMRNYERTNADRCYLSAAAAEAEGHRESKV